MLNQMHKERYEDSGFGHRYVIGSNGGLDGRRDRSISLPCAPETPWGMGCKKTSFDEIVQGEIINPKLIKRCT